MNVIFRDTEASFFYVGSEDTNILEHSEFLRLDLVIVLEHLREVDCIRQGGICSQFIP